MLVPLWGFLRGMWELDQGAGLYGILPLDKTTLSAKARTETAKTRVRV